MPALKFHKHWLILLLIAGFAMRGQQVPYLERSVSLHATGKSLSEIFRQISAQTSVVFSYSQPFNDQQKATVNCSKKPLRLVLNELLKESGCRYNAKGKFIIIRCDAKPASQPSILTGYIYNAEDSSVVANASIYLKQGKHSSQSNEYGFFSLSYSDKLPSLSVSFARENYYDSTLVILNRQKQELVMYLYPRFHQKDSVVQTLVLPQKDSVVIVTRRDTVVVPQQRFFSKFWQPAKVSNTNLRNISDTLFSHVAISFVPYISTNRLLSINTVNMVSFNILAGYSKGVKAFELAGLMNVDNGNVGYAQIAGLANIVSGTSGGAQVAGLLNLNRQKTVGAQIAGVMNVDLSDVEGAQAGGIGNINSGSTKGFQLAGVFNVSGQRLLGMQLAGIVNTADTAAGMQLAGIVNVATQSKGLQLAGLANIADSSKGMQFAGICNASGLTEGLQFAGILNRSAHLKGVQFALVNMADSSSGVSIGLFNYVKTGYHKLEIGTDELLFANLGFGAGTEQFYTTLSLGVSSARPDIVTYGYGIGSGFRLKDKLGLCVNLSAQQLQSTSDGHFRSNLLSRAYLGLEYRFLPKFRIGLGPTFNLYSPNLTDNANSDLLPELPPNQWAGYTDPSGLSMWLGAKLSLKFF